MGYRYSCAGRTLTLAPVPTLFSPDHPDAGTLAMLSTVTFRQGMRVLDLGCGNGLVGLCAALTVGAENVWLCDVDQDAVDCARKNADTNGLPVHIVLSDAYDALDVSGFDLILSNPPYHTDFAVAKRFIEKGFNRLKIGGELVMVTKRLDWYRNKLTSVFGGVRVTERDGYCIFRAQRRDYARANTRKKG